MSASTATTGCGIDALKDGVAADNGPTPTATVNRP